MSRPSPIIVTLLSHPRGDGAVTPPDQHGRRGGLPGPPVRRRRGEAKTRDRARPSPDGPPLAEVAGARPAGRAPSRAAGRAGAASGMQATVRRAAAANLTAPAVGRRPVPSGPSSRVRPSQRPPAERTGASTRTVNKPAVRTQTASLSLSPPKQTPPVEAPTVPAPDTLAAPGPHLDACSAATPRGLAGRRCYPAAQPLGAGAQKQGHRSQGTARPEGGAPEAGAPGLAEKPARPPRRRPVRVSRQRRKPRLPHPHPRPSSCTCPSRRPGRRRRRGGGSAASRRGPAARRPRRARCPTGADQVGDAREGGRPSRTPRRKAKAQQELIAPVQGRARAPRSSSSASASARSSARSARPTRTRWSRPKPEGEALNAGNQLNSTVEGETKKVQGNYGADGRASPAPRAGAQGRSCRRSRPPPRRRRSTRRRRCPTPVPAEQRLARQGRGREPRKKAEDAGMDTPRRRSSCRAGPIAEARARAGRARPGREGGPGQGPRRAEGGARPRPKATWPRCRRRRSPRSTASRAGTAKGNDGAAGRHGRLRGVDARQGRRRGAADLQRRAERRSTALLKPLPPNAMAEWDAAKTCSPPSSRPTSAVVQERVDERHSGVGGFVVGLWDAVTGLPDWADGGLRRGREQLRATA